MAAIILISSWGPSGESPIGSRHLTTNATFSGYLDNINSPLIFNPINIADFGSGISNTKIFTMIPSGNMNNKEIQGMKVWNSNTASGIVFYYMASGTWVQNKVIGIGNLVMPSSLPIRQNLLRQDDISGILGGSGDSDCTQFVYIAAHSSGIPAQLYKPQIRISYFELT